MDFTHFHFNQMVLKCFVAVVVWCCCKGITWGTHFQGVANYSHPPPRPLTWTILSFWCYRVAAGIPTGCFKRRVNGNFIPQSYVTLYKTVFSACCLLGWSWLLLDIPDWSDFPDELLFPDERAMPLYVCVSTSSDVSETYVF